MSARATATTILLLLILAVVGVIVLFVVQNSARATQLSLDLGFAAWQLADPVPVVALVGGAFGLGFVIGAGWFGIRSMQLSSKVRRLEQEIALSGSGTGQPWR